MKRPILFSAPMVRAILEGRKTQTRRPLKMQPADILPMRGELKGVNWVTLRERLEKIEDQRGDVIRCRFGVPGDRLWVRETWATICKVALPYCECETEEARKENHYIEYRADTGNPYPGDWPEDEARGNDDAPKWKPSIFMPRSASRITLEIVDIRVERVQQISREDILAEGIKQTGGGFLAPLAGVPDFPWVRAELAYSALWNSINEKRGFGWDSNPWVWVLEFRMQAGQMEMNLDKPV